MNLAEAIKQCSMDAWETSVPCDVMLGVVTGTDPVKITIGEIKIPAELLYVPEHLTYREEEIKLGVYERTVVINKGLSAGDEVIVMRKSGGGGYAVIGKL
ncbi:MAG: DUF2577 domain-containing protein [Clostridia bacterium]|nr:DUF2577 domain-containing protein [Clostridia bacterium]